MVNEKRILEYLDRHIGNRITFFELVKDAKACEGMNDDEIQKKIMTIARIVYEIAKDNGYRFNGDHHDYDETDRQWRDNDFYIEISDVEKDIARIKSAFQIKMKIVLIIEEYGIYDEEKDRMIGFRTSIPWQIKKLYDELSDELERLETDGTIIG